MKSRIIKSLFAVALMAPVLAIAVPINGSIRMGGDASPGCALPEGDNGTECNLGNADTVIFGTSFVVGADGDFAPALGATTLNGTLDLTEITIDPFNGPLTIWQIFAAPAEGGQSPLFSFTLDSLSILSQTAGQLILRGTGVVSADGFDDTAGRWSFSAQDLRGSRSVNFSWSSETEQVPEPGVLMLLGLGVLGLIRLRRSA